MHEHSRREGQRVECRSGRSRRIENPGLPVIMQCQRLSDLVARTGFRAAVESERAKPSAEERQHRMAAAAAMVMGHAWALLRGAWMTTCSDPMAATCRFIRRSLEIIKTRAPTPDGHALAPMDGTPYAVQSSGWNSPLGVPCSQPPFSTLTAIDLDSRKIAWQIPAGTAKMLGPLGIRLGLPLTPGMPSYARTSATTGSLVFYAGTQDYYLRAFSASTGMSARTCIQDDLA